MDGYVCSCVLNVSAANSSRLLDQSQWSFTTEGSWLHSSSGCTVHICSLCHNMHCSRKHLSQSWITSHLIPCRGGVCCRVKSGDVIFSRGKHPRLGQFRIIIRMFKNLMGWRYLSEWDLFHLHKQGIAVFGTSCCEDISPCPLKNVLQVIQY